MLDVDIIVLDQHFFTVMRPGRNYTIQSSSGSRFTRGLVVLAEAKGEEEGT